MPANLSRPPNRICIWKLDCVFLNVTYGRKEAVPPLHSLLPVEGMGLRGYFNSESKPSKHDQPAPSLRNSIIGQLNDLPPGLIAERFQTFDKFLKKNFPPVCQPRNVFEHYGLRKCFPGYAGNLSHQIIPRILLVVLASE